MAGCSQFGRSIADVHWLAWGGSVARGAGTYRIPRRGSEAFRNARIEASQVKTCAAPTGPSRAYTRIQVWYEPAATPDAPDADLPGGTDSWVRDCNFPYQVTIGVSSPILFSAIPNPSPKELTLSDLHGAFGKSAAVRNRIARDRRWRALGLQAQMITWNRAAACKEGMIDSVTLTSPRWTVNRGVRVGMSRAVVRRKSVGACTKKSCGHVPGFIIARSSSACPRGLMPSVIADIKNGRVFRIRIKRNICLYD